MLPTSILKLFARSPFNPIQEHMAVVNKCAKTLDKFFEAVFASDWDEAEELQDRVAQLERKADDIKRDIRLHLPKSLFLPVSRGDLLQLLATQDMIANKAKDIAGLIIGRKMHFPDMLNAPIRKLVHRSIDATTQAYKAIRELNELSEAGFRGSEVEIVKKLLKKLDQIEHESDQLQKNVHHILFKLETDLPPVEVIFLYKIIEWIGDLADRAQQAGGKVHLLLAR